jgi:hypothetical protein
MRVPELTRDFVRSAGQNQLGLCGERDCDRPVRTAPDGRCRRCAVGVVVLGRLASVFVLLLYLWLSANAFLVGIQVDACVRERA